MTFITRLLQALGGACFPALGVCTTCLLAMIYSLVTMTIGSGEMGPRAGNSLFDFDSLIRRPVSRVYLFYYFALCRIYLETDLVADGNYNRPYADYLHHYPPGSIKKDCKKKGHKKFSYVLFLSKIGYFLRVLAAVGLALHLAIKSAGDSKPSKFCPLVRVPGLAPMETKYLYISRLQSNAAKPRGVKVCF